VVVHGVLCSIACGSSDFHCLAFDLRFVEMASVGGFVMRKMRVTRTKELNRPRVTPRDQRVSRTEALSYGCRR